MADTYFTTPVGRLVAGSVYRPSERDADGNPLVIKKGPNVGKPRVDYFMAIAIPKGPESHWSETEWGKVIWSVGHAFMAQAGRMPTFAWKVTDGDSQVPNQRGRTPASREGYPGCWVLAYSSGYQSKVFTVLGGGKVTPLLDHDAINLGDYVQINGTVAGNGSQSRPGVYLNHTMICLVGYGERIVVGPDPEAAGFGGALPPGASTIPVGGFAVAAPPVAGHVVQPPVAAPLVAAPPTGGHVLQPPVGGHVVQPPVAAPYSGYMTPPVPPAAPPVPVARTMTAKAGGVAYEAFIQGGWTDQALRDNGMMV